MFLNITVLRVQLLFFIRADQLEAKIRFAFIYFSATQSSKQKRNKIINTKDLKQTCIITPLKALLH